MTRTVGVGRCRVCKLGTSLLPTHICPDCWTDRETPVFPAVEFVDELPEGGRRQWDAARRRVVRDFAAALKANPDRWAKYPIPAPSNNAARAMASRITNGRIAAFADGFQAVGRGDTTYVRYIGEE